MSAAELALIDQVARFRHDPFGYVRFTYPWGEPGALESMTGPRAWQSAVLQEIGAHLRDPVTRHRPYRKAIASGHGIGKSALVRFVSDWALSTCPDARVVITANTEGQLRTKTWPELGKWHPLAINAHWWKYHATSIESADGGHAKTWRADAIPWSERQPEAFAGLHNQGKRILLVFDEASAIPDKIWEVAEGALTDEGTEIIWLAFGNPTRNNGRFFEAVEGRHRHLWRPLQIDSRTVEGTNKEHLQELVDTWGEDHDVVRVRVRGIFPRAGSLQFIASDVVRAAMEREATSTIYDPVIVGVDVARFGDDQSVIWTRRGRDAQTVPPRKFRGIDTMQLAAQVAMHAEEHRADMIFVDGTGVGGGVVDRLRQLNHRVQEVHNGGRPDGYVDGENVHDKSTEMWARMRAWLKAGGAIPDDDELRAELEGREYGYDAKMCLRIERKDDMKKRGLASPDCADALALTFAYPVTAKGDPAATSAGKAVTEWDPFAQR